MRMTPIGVGDAFSSLHYSSSVVLEAGGERLLIDCPHPIRKILRESAQLDVGDISAVALTHLHADHVSGLEGMAYFAYYVVRRKLQLLAHPSVVERLWDGHLAGSMEQLLFEDGRRERKRFEDFFDWTELSTERPVTVGAFTVEARPTIHHIPTTAFRVRAGGRTLGYSADTSFDPSLIAWLSEADLFVHETNFGVHTPYAKLAALPPELRAKMRLIHYWDGFEGDAIEKLVEGRSLDV
jgi:ribonuclease BN (tRNA processing enzyme)